MSKMNPIDAITKLGELEAAEIARLLGDLGIKGQRRSPDRCPIAQYLVRETAASFASVGVDRYMVIGVDEHTLLGDGSNDLPASVTAFITRFDTDEYPALIDNEKTS